MRNIRTRLLVIVLLALAAALAVSTVGFNLLFARTTSRSADSLLRARGSSELGLLALRHGRLVASETRDDSLADTKIWIFSHSRVIERPREQTSVDGIAGSLAGGPPRLLNVSATDVRLYAVPIVIRGKREGTLVTGLSLAPYDSTRRSAL